MGRKSPARPSTSPEKPPAAGAISSNTFISPHKRDKTIVHRQNGRVVDREQTVVTLTSLRDIYENNANMASRRERQAIFAILPDWYTEEALDICRATIEQGDGTPIKER